MGERSLSLLERIIAASRLSPIFARGAIERALRRSGLEPDELTRSNVKRAMPELRRAVEPFMHAETDEVMKEIERVIDKAAA
jgi:hypothetical protein